MAGISSMVRHQFPVHRAVCLVFLSIITICSAGCIAEHPSPAEEEGIQLITPDEGFSIFDGQGHYSGLIGEENPQIPANYSLGIVTLPPGHATATHRLMGTSEMVCLVGGEAEIHCDNSSVFVHDGEIVVLPKGVLQSITAVGDGELCYIDVVQPPFSPAAEISGDELDTVAAVPNALPIVIPDPREGIEWDVGSDMMIYTVANPVLMPEVHLPIDYSVAYAELLPGGAADANKLTGASELIYVIAGEIEVFTPEGDVARAPAGSAVWIAPDQVKGYRNAGAVNASMLSFVDPAWTPERTVTVE